MKTQLRSLLPVLGLAATLPLSLARADASPKHLRILAAAGEPDAKVEKRIVIRHGGEPAEMKKVAFLGVETAPVAPELGAQLNLAPDSGLVVRHVVPASPVATLLQQHDVLLKLDDQQLIDPRQFSVLVRNHKAGDEVTVTYLRAGKEATVKVKLAEHEVPKHAFFQAGGGEGDLKYFVQSGGTPMPSEDLNRTLSLLDQAHASAAGGPHRIVINSPGFSSTTVNTSNSNMVFSDDDGSLELTIKDGKKSVVAKSAKGETQYSGPVDTPEQRKALPDAVRARLEKIEGMQEFSFRAEGEPAGDVLKATPRGIALPLPADVEAGDTPEMRVM